MTSQVTVTCQVTVIFNALSSEEFVDGHAGHVGYVTCYQDVTARSALCDEAIARKPILTAWREIALQKALATK